MRPDLEAAVRRNTLVLAGGMAALYGMAELALGTATLTFEEVGGSDSMSGFAPAAFLAAAAVVAVPAGRAMDRLGRAPVLAGGFAAAAIGSLTASLAVIVDSIVLVLLAFVVVGVGLGTVMLSRTAAADMYPPERRARGISLILFGAVFGALLGPLVFIPLIESGEHGSALGPAWLGGAGFVVVGLLLMTRLRPDPRQLAHDLGYDLEIDAGPADPLRAVLARPGVVPSIVPAVASWGAMVPVMALAGASLVDHGHSHSAIFPVVAAHFVGMFGLFPIVGRAVDRLGTAPSMSAGLLMLAASSTSLLAALESVPLAALALLGVGLGWNVAYVAASTELADLSRPSERGGLLGFADALSNVATASLVIVGALALAAGGVATLSLGGAAIAAVPALWILRGAIVGAAAEAEA